MKENPDENIRYKTECFVEEFNAIFLYSRIWTETGIANTGIIDFLYNHRDLLFDLPNPNMTEICRPIELFISAIIWTWDCRNLVDICVWITNTYPKNSLPELIKNSFRDLYPYSFHQINIPYITWILSFPDPKTAALALYRRKDPRVIPPKRDIKLFKKYFGEYPVPLFLDSWNIVYGKFLEHIK